MSKSNNQGNLFCFGLGYSAQFLAKRLIPKNWLVSGSYRDPKAITSIKKNTPTDKSQWGQGEATVSSHNALNQKKS